MRPSRSPSRSIALASWVVAGCAGSAGQPPAAPAAAAPDRPALPSRFDPAAIDAYVAAQVKERELVGASLVVVQGGQVVLARGYGVTSLSSPVPVTADTPFGIGSVTKQFVCAAALLLEQDGALSLDDTVAAHVPGLTRAGDIRLDDLGAHLSGYPDYYPLDFVDRRMRQPIEPDEILRRYAAVPLDFEPRTRWSYSNTGFILLGRVIEKVSRMPLADFLARRIFGPIGMTHASLGPGDERGRAAGHVSFALGRPRPLAAEAREWLHAAAGMYASAHDLARWDLALVGGALLSPRSYARMTTPRTLADGRATDYGCGIGVRRVAGETILAHTGAVAGFLSFNAVVPRTRSAVILLVNTEGGSPGDLHQQILGLLLGPLNRAPVIRGAPAAEVALDLFRQMQRGSFDRTRVSPELADYAEEARLADAAPRLRALGEPDAVEVADLRERGGMEVASLRFHFADRVVKAVLYRTPDGVVREFLLLRD